MNAKIEIVIVGCGYVGLPLALAFAKKGFNTIGYDLSEEKIKSLNKGKFDADIIDSLPSLSNLTFTYKLNESAVMRFYIVTVPTPVDESKKPDFGPLISASQKIGDIYKKGDIVVYESTVYPGATKEICVNEICKFSGLKIEDISYGYSPERINPGDKINNLTNITKIASGSSDEVLNQICWLYENIINAGVFKAKSIEVAESAKVVENIQRDVNIALMNELKQIFDSIDIDVDDVIDAASTKWNFMNVRPGLVGGHCIGVDPYYLISKARINNINPLLIQSARDINESAVEYTINNMLKHFARNGIQITKLKFLFYGITFKPNCGDTRNSKFFELFLRLKDNLKFDIDYYDPYVSSHNPASDFDYIILGTNHSQFKKFKKEHKKPIYHLL